MQILLLFTSKLSGISIIQMLYSCINQINVIVIIDQTPVQASKKKLLDTEFWGSTARKKNSNWNLPRITQFQFITGPFFADRTHDSNLRPNSVDLPEESFRSFYFSPSRFTFSFLFLSICVSNNSCFLIYTYGITINFETCDNLSIKFDYLRQTT